MKSKQPLPTNDLIATMSTEELDTLITTLPTFEAEDFAASVDGIEPQFNIQEVKREDLISADKEVNPDLDEDFKLATANLRALIQNSETIFKDLVSVARTSDSPRAYEVVANMVNTLVNANNELLNMHKKHSDIKAKITPEVSVDTQNITNNNVFIGTHTDVLDLLNTLPPVEKEVK